MQFSRGALNFGRSKGEPNRLTRERRGNRVRGDGREERGCSKGTGRGNGPNSGVVTRGRRLRVLENI